MDLSRHVVSLEFSCLLTRNVGIRSVSVFVVLHRLCLVMFSSHADAFKISPPRSPIEPGEEHGVYCAWANWHPTSSGMLLDPEVVLLATCTRSLDNPS